MNEELYTLVQAGALGVHQMCRRCGALIAMSPREVPDGAVTPEQAHTAFHHGVDSILGLVKDLGGMEQGRRP